ncbi:sterol desaturase [Zymobacter palmae]|uniref:Sterol desaturase n=1 Tax=Zymobacter palmae TaxID=33074 RepID=A0A348HBG0_9GAMM|nr:sterol desaturase [Zymobacter palmae]
MVPALSWVGTVISGLSLWVQTARSRYDHVQRHIPRFRRQCSYFLHIMRQSDESGPFEGPFGVACTAEGTVIKAAPHS